MHQFFWVVLMRCDSRTGLLEAGMKSPHYTHWLDYTTGSNWEKKGSRRRPLLSKCNRQQNDTSFSHSTYFNMYLIKYVHHVPMHLIYASQHASFTASAGEDKLSAWYEHVPWPVSNECSPAGCMGVPWSWRCSPDFRELMKTERRHLYASWLSPHLAERENHDWISKLNLYVIWNTF